MDGGVGGLFEDGAGLVFEHCGAAEAEFFYEEIFTRRCYCHGGVALPLHGAPVVVDVGASVGLFSLWCLRTNGRARIVAVEPAPRTFAALERNLAHAHAATCVRAAIADRQGVSTLHVFTDAPGESTRHLHERRMQRRRLQAHVAQASASLTHLGRDALVAAGVDAAGSAATASGGDAKEDADAHTRVAVTLTTLSALFESEQIDGVDLLKVDCEGDELEVLRGIHKRHWQMIRQIAIEAHDYRGRLSEIVGLLRGHDFHVTVEAQRSGAVRGYHMEIPDTLSLHYVYATRTMSKQQHRRTSRSTSRNQRDLVKLEHE